jgi:hypothetical protein
MESDIHPQAKQINMRYKLGSNVKAGDYNPQFGYWGGNLIWMNLNYFDTNSEHGHQICASTVDKSRTSDVYQGILQLLRGTQNSFLSLSQQMKCGFTGTECTKRYAMISGTCNLGTKIDKWLFQMSACIAYLVLAALECPAWTTLTDNDMRSYIITRM